ncbi:MAG: hypothetical protein LCH38_06380 [Proteobacteria bacterium]|nr:hypothetical protein [Pseudomonadota bacterium]
MNGASRFGAWPKKHFAFLSSLLLLTGVLMCCDDTAQAQTSAPDQTTLGAHNKKPPSETVRVENHSEPEVCAEKDNIDIRFLGPEIRKFRVQAIHPAYIGTLKEDLALPDFTDCDMSSDPVFNPGKPRQVTLYETPWLWIVGQVYPGFWRPADVPVKVGDKVEHGIHLVQVYQRIGQRMEEMLVVYPPDGYWRARPLPAKHMNWTAYGSSFMVGPVTMEGRPVVAFKEIRFEPETLTFHFPFRDGGEGSLKLDKLDFDHISLEVELSGNLPKDKPFAALRSMYVTEINNDASRVAYRRKGVTRWGEEHILDYKGGDTTEFWAGRYTPSRHNMSSPDMTFSRFSK